MMFRHKILPGTQGMNLSTENCVYLPNKNESFEIRVDYALKTESTSFFRGEKPLSNVSSYKLNEKLETVLNSLTKVTHAEKEMFSSKNLFQ